MKYYLILLLTIAFSAFSCKNDEGKSSGKNRSSKDAKYEDEDENSTDDNNDQWSKKDIAKFNDACRKGLNSVNVSEDIIAEICPCVLEKVKKRYSSFREADERGNKELISKMTQKCISELDIPVNDYSNNDEINTDEGWSNTEVSVYVNTCCSSLVKTGYTMRKARDYCSCMQQKFEAIYPSISELSELGEARIEELSKEYAGECLVIE